MSSIIYNTTSAKSLASLPSSISCSFAMSTTFTPKFNSSYQSQPMATDQKIICNLKDKDGKQTGTCSVSTFGNISHKYTLNITSPTACILKR